MEKIFCGVDCGISGGLVFLNEKCEILRMHVMPTYEVETNKKLPSGRFKKLRMVDTDKLIDLFKGCANVSIYIEKVHSVHSSSASSNWQFGFNVGSVHATIRAMRLGFNLIKPKDWQKSVVINSDVVLKKDGKTRDTKKTAANTAARVFPGMDFTLTKRQTIPHDGIVDAALIGYVGCKIEGIL